MARIKVRAFSVPKAGNAPEENEDACTFDEELYRVAVADGASDAFDSGKWASALVQYFVDEPPQFDAPSVLAWLAAPIQFWEASIHWERLPWYSEEKARRGAFATFIGVVFSSPSPTALQSKECVWRAIAVGDCCLFHVRGRVLLASFPLSRAVEFNTTPSLLATNIGYSERSLEELRTMMGVCEEGDSFLIGTDALAAWLLAKTEADPAIASKIASMSQDEIRSLIDNLRATREMRNDDVSIVVIDCVCSAT